MERKNEQWGPEKPGCISDFVSNIFYTLNSYFAVSALLIQY